MITTVQAEPFKHCTEVLPEDLMRTRCPGHHSTEIKHQLPTGSTVQNYANSLSPSPFQRVQHMHPWHQAFFSEAG